MAIGYIRQADWPTLGKFRFWLASGAEGRARTFTYHFGFVAQDRGQWVAGPIGAALGGMKWVRCEEVDELAKLAWEAYERGEVTLVQRKHARFWYEYIAIRR